MLQTIQKPSQSLNREGPPLHMITLHSDPNSFEIHLKQIEPSP